MSRYDVSLPPFPKGWYNLGLSKDLVAGEIKSFTFCGNEVVLFRTETGKAALLGAYCPHLGAHLGHGGEICGESIRCPFHSFRFNTSGTCVATGYNTTVPDNTSIRSYPIQEVNEFMLAYFDINGVSPDWEVPSLDFSDWNPILTTSWELDSHPQETAENSVDIGHFMIVHGYDGVETISKAKGDGRYFTATYSMLRDGKEFGKKGKIKAQFTLEIFGFGYSIVHVHIADLDLKYRSFVLPTPTREGKVMLTIGMSSAKVIKPGKVHPLLTVMPKSMVNYIINKMSFRAYANDVSQDFKIWQNKIYIPNPPLAKGDGPVPIYRNWAKQFYE